MLLLELSGSQIEFERFLIGEEVNLGILTLYRVSHKKYNTGLYIHNTLFFCLTNISDYTKDLTYIRGKEDHIKTLSAGLFLHSKLHKSFCCQIDGRRTKISQKASKQKYQPIFLVVSSQSR